MAIDMSTVKAITHNNKDVTKIQDSLGNVLWQKGEEPSLELFMSRSSYQYSLENGEWVTKTWSGLSSFNATDIWTDGTDLYYSNGETHRVFNKSLSAWETKTWYGLTYFNGNYIWTDGTDIYYSNSTNQYVLDKATSTWSQQSWGGTAPSSMTGNNMWTDGTDVYYSNGSVGYIFDKTTKTWSTSSKAVIVSSSNYGYAVWTDGTNLYFSNGTTQRVYNENTQTWENKTWTGLTSFQGGRIFVYNNEYYAIPNSTPYYMYKLNIATSTWTETTLGTNQPHNSNFAGNGAWNYGGRLCTVATAYPRKS